ncbi:MAG: MATE family efflux transporter, partial [Planctomycetota bacterium]
AMVGQALGGGHVSRAERAGWAAAIFDVMTMVGIGLLYYLFTPWFVSAFAKDPVDAPTFLRMHELAVEYLRITVIAYAFAAVAITLAHALNGAGSTKTPLLLDSMVLALQLPVAAYICIHHAERGYSRSTLWWSLVLTTIVAAALYALVWERGHWKHKRVQ